jgi:hypothetical protein
VRKIFGLTMVFVLLGASAPIAPSNAVERELVKYGLDALSEQRRSRLFQQIDDFALYEAFLISCNRPSAIERRVTRGIEACVKPEALREVSRHFRSKLASFSQGNPSCEDPKSKELIGKLHKLIDDQVNEVTRLCNQCLICRL